MYVLCLYVELNVRFYFLAGFAFMQSANNPPRRAMKIIRLPTCGSENFKATSSFATANPASRIPVIPSPAISPDVKSTPLSVRAFFSSSVPLIF